MPKTEENTQDSGKRVYHWRDFHPDFPKETRLLFQAIHNRDLALARQLIKQGFFEPNDIMLQDFWSGAQYPDNSSKLRIAMYQAILGQDVSRVKQLLDDGFYPHDTWVYKVGSEEYKTDPLQNLPWDLPLPWPRQTNRRTSTAIDLITQYGNLPILKAFIQAGYLFELSSRHESATWQLLINACALSESLESNPVGYDRVIELATYLFALGFDNSLPNNDRYKHPKLMYEQIQELTEERLKTASLFILEEATRRKHRIILSYQDALSCQLYDETFFEFQRPFPIAYIHFTTNIRGKALVEIVARDINVMPFLCEVLDAHPATQQSRSVMYVIDGTKMTPEDIMQHAHNIMARLKLLDDPNNVDDDILKSRIKACDEPVASITENFKQAIQKYLFDLASGFPGGNIYQNGNIFKRIEKFKADKIPNYWAEKLFQSVRSGNVEETCPMLRSRLDPNITQLGWTALNILVAYGPRFCKSIKDLETMMALLLDYGAKVTTDTQQETAIETATLQATINPRQIVIYVHLMRFLIGTGDKRQQMPIHPSRSEAPLSIFLAKANAQLTKQSTMLTQSPLVTHITVIDKPEPYRFTYKYRHATTHQEQRKQGTFTPAYRFRFSMRDGNTIDVFPMSLDLIDERYLLGYLQIFKDNPPPGQETMGELAFMLYFMAIFNANNPHKQVISVMLNGELAGFDVIEMRRLGNKQRKVSFIDLGVATKAVTSRYPRFMSLVALYPGYAGNCTDTYWQAASGAAFFQGDEQRFPRYDDQEAVAQLIANEFLSWYRAVRNNPKGKFGIFAKSFYATTSPDVIFSQWPNEREIANFVYQQFFEKAGWSTLIHFPCNPETFQRLATKINNRLGVDVFETVVQNASFLSLKAKL